MIFILFFLIFFFKISLLPSWLNILVAESCLKFKKHLVTASYISPELMALGPK